MPFIIKELTVLSMVFTFELLFCAFAIELFIKSNSVQFTCIKCLLKFILYRCLLLNCLLKCFSAVHNFNLLIRVILRKVTNFNRKNTTALSFFFFVQS